MRGFGAVVSLRGCRCYIAAFHVSVDFRIHASVVLVLTVLTLTSVYFVMTGPVSPSMFQASATGRVPRTLKPKPSTPNHKPQSPKAAGLETIKPLKP